MFFGKFPPRGFQERPAARYLLPSDSNVDAPLPQGLRPGATPFAGTKAAAPAPAPGPTSREDGPSLEDPPSPDTLVGAPADASGEEPPRSGVPPAPVPGAPTPQFLPTSEVPSDRRGAGRIELFVNFTIQLVDEWGAVLQEELTVADNVSRGGARVMTSLRFEPGEILLLQEAGGGFATRAEIRGITNVQAAVDRLHLRFVDRQAPDRLLRQ
jgi:hypothetical protein